MSMAFAADGSGDDSDWAHRLVPLPMLADSRVLADRLSGKADVKSVQTVSQEESAL
jgi:hypothetical protein